MKNKLGMRKTAQEGEKQELASASSDPETLARLAKDKDEDVRFFVADNENTPPETLAKLAKDENTNVRYNVAGNSHTPSEILVELSKDKKSFVHQAVAYNPNTPPETLTELAKDKDKDVRSYIARNLNTPSEILVELSKDRDGYVRMNIASNPHTPPETLALLFHDKDKDVKQRALENPNTPKKTIPKSTWFKQHVTDLFDQVIMEREATFPPEFVEELGDELELEKPVLPTPPPLTNELILSKVLELLAKERGVSKLDKRTEFKATQILQKIFREQEIELAEEIGEIPPPPISEVEEREKLTEETVEVPYATLLNKYTADQIFDIAAGRKTDVTAEEIEQAKDVITRGIVANKLSMRKKGSDKITKQELRRLYEQEAKGIYDEELMDEIISSFIVSLSNISKKKRKDIIIGGDVTAGELYWEFIKPLENAKTSQEKMIAIDKAVNLAHQFSYFVRFLVEGGNKAFLDELAGLTEISYFRKIQESGVDSLSNLSTRDKFELAQDPNTSAEFLAELAKDDFVCIMVAQNPNAFPETLAELAKNEDEMVRENVMDNPNTPLEVKEQLRKKQTTFGLNMRKEAQSTLETIQKAQTGDENAIAQVIEENTGLISQALINWGYVPKSDEFEDVMSDIKVEMLNKIIPRYDPSRGAFSTFLSTAVSNYLKNLPTRKEYKGREKEISMETPISEDITLGETLEDSTSKIVQMTLSSARENLQIWLHMKNPELEDIVLRIFDLKIEDYSHGQIAEILNKEGYTSKDKAITKNMVSNYFRSFVKPALAQFFEAFKTASLNMRSFGKKLTIKERKILAEDPSTPPETLTELAKDKNLELRSYIAKNPSTPPETLIDLSKLSLGTKYWHEVLSIFLGIVRNPSSPPEALIELAKGVNYEVLFLVLRHPNTPSKVKKQLNRELNEKLGEDRKDYEDLIMNPPLSKEDLLEILKEKERKKRKKKDLRETKEELEEEEEEPETKEIKPEPISKTPYTEVVEKYTPELLNKYTTDQIFDIAAGRKTDVTAEEIEQAKDVITRGIVANKLSMRKKGK